jgi:RecB family exonuclease
MARMIAKVYDARKSAGAAGDKARAAATAVAGQLEFDGRLDRIDTRLDRMEVRAAKLETDTAVLKWMVGANIALTVLVLGKLLIP